MWSHLQPHLDVSLSHIHFAFPSRLALLSIGKGLLAKENRQHKRTPGIILFKWLLSLPISTVSLLTKVLLAVQSPNEITLQPGLLAELASREWNVATRMKCTSHSSIMYKEIRPVQAGQSGLESKSQLRSAAFFNVHVAFAYCAMPPKLHHSPSQTLQSLTNWTPYYIVRIRTGYCLGSVSAPGEQDSILNEDWGHLSQISRKRLFAKNSKDKVFFKRKIDIKNRGKGLSVPLPPA